MANTSLYVIALGSNRRSRHGSPAATLKAAIAAVAELGEIERTSRVRATPALGPAGRGFANAILILRTASEPDALLTGLKAIEQVFGRRGGRRWGPRVLDLDIILWSEGAWADGGPVIPHPEFRRRPFVLEPLAEIAAEWRDPISGATMRQLLHRLRRSAPVDRTLPGS